MDQPTNGDVTQAVIKRPKQKLYLWEKFRKLSRSKKQIFQLAALLLMSITAVAGGSTIKNFVTRIFIGAAGENTQISINAPVSATTGTSFTANLVVNTDLSAVSGVDFAISFPKELLVLESITPLGSPNTLTTFTPLTIDNTFDANKVIVSANNTGVIKFGALAEYMAGMSWSNQNPLTGTVTVARFMFRTLSPGSATLTIQKNGVAATDSHIWKEADGRDILASVQNTTIQILAPTPTPTPTPTSTPSPTSTPVPTSDTTPPTIALTGPTADTLTAGTKISLSATATDNVKVAKVVFNVDNKDICTDSTAPYSCTWRPNKRALGQHIIFVKAFDEANNSAQTTKTVTLVK